MPSRKLRKASQTSQPPADALGKESPSFTPALVVLWSHDGEVVGSLQANVTRRLAVYAEIGALQWVALSPRQEVKSQELAQACGPLLSWDLWQRLVDRGYRSALPKPGSPVQIQVILVVDGMTGEVKKPPLSVMKEMREHLRGQADLAPVLIWLGEKPEPPPKDLNLYWPRIRMEPVAAGGIGVRPHLVWEATEHLLVALIGSAFVPLVNRMIPKKKAEWLVLGASALQLHPDMEKWLSEAILKEILASLIVPLPELERERVEKAMEEQAQKIRKALREEATVVLQEMGWETRIDGPVVQQCTLKNRELLETIFGPYSGGVTAQNFNFREWKDWPRHFWTLISALARPFQPNPKLGGILQRHYQELSDRMEQWMSPQRWRGMATLVLEEYRDLSVLLGALLDRGMISRISPERQPSWWEERPLPTGLPAVLMALLSLEKYLCEEGDLKYEDSWVRPEPLNTRAYLQTAGETDATIVQWNLLRYAHFVRSIASPWGVLLYLLPAWPLAVFLVQSFAQWGTAQVALATGLGLLVIGLGELAYWWLLKARKLLKSVQKEAHRYLSSRILRLAASAIRDYRHWMLTQLREAELALADLYGVCLRRHREAERASQALEEFRPQMKGCTYILAFQRETVDSWKKQALEEIYRHREWITEGGNEKTFHSAVTALIVREVWPLSEHPMPGEEVLRKLEALCREKVRQTAPPPQQWRPGIFAEDVDLLKRGKRWEWLWNHACPLGRVESPAGEFTIIMASEEMLSGSTGKGSPYWQSEWQIAPTFLSEEEICIRGLIEPKRGE